jgi:hypothetical protein
VFSDRLRCHRDIDEVIRALRQLLSRRYSIDQKVNAIFRLREAVAGSRVTFRVHGRKVGLYRVIDPTDTSDCAFRVEGVNHDSDLMERLSKSSDLVLEADLDLGFLRIVVINFEAPLDWGRIKELARGLRSLLRQHPEYLEQRAPTTN